MRWIGTLVSDWPSSRMSPAWYWYSRLMQLNSVVLPAPLGPIRPQMSPRSTSKLTLSSATMPPKRTDTPRTLSKELPPDDGVRCADGFCHVVLVDTRGVACAAQPLGL